MAWAIWNQSVHECILLPMCSRWEEDVIRSAVSELTTDGSQQLFLIMNLFIVCH